MTEVCFYSPDYFPDKQLKYSVISARYSGKWIFVRHRKRDTWEIPGGHIENGESPYDAAGRELTEETGAVKFNLTCIATYSVTIDGDTGWGRLFFADVEKIGPLPDYSEIGETITNDRLPENLTYPAIQPYLFKKVVEYLEEHL